MSKRITFFQLNGISYHAVFAYKCASTDKCTVPYLGLCTDYTWCAKIC